MSPKDWFLSASRTPALVVIFAIVASSVSAAEWKEKVLYSFQGGIDGGPDGAVPAGGVVFDKEGNLYGATADGGSGCISSGCGTVFQLVPPAQKGGAWKENILYMFRGTDGSNPEGGVILDAAGNVYGTTAYGGSGPCTLFGSTVGCGVVYEMIRPAQAKGTWKEKILYNFQGDRDGQFPIGDLVFDKAGNLYGATQFGGGYGSCDAPFYQHCGTIFELVAPKTKGGKWTEKLLHSFKAGKDGANPNGGLVFDRKGAIYGTTYSGANRDCDFGQGEIGCGMVFKLLPPGAKESAWTEHVLHRFRAADDGGQPNGSLVLDETGRLYGTAGGGANQGKGVFFRLSSTSRGTWDDAVLFDLRNDRNGTSPEAGVILDAERNLYGTTSGGGAFGDGTIIRLHSASANSWAISVLYSFKGDPDGSYPASRLIFDTAGNLYGTTQHSGNGQNCGNLGCGTVYRLEPSNDHPAGSFILSN
jgi:uncharacterized repeat protein (TIGR03803 family)